jgi:hypothetical protein
MYSLEVPNVSRNVKKNLSVMDIYATRDFVMPSLWRIVVMLAFVVFSESTTNWNLMSTSMSTALASFDGGKFMFSHSPGLYVCEKSVQQKAMRLPKNQLLSAPIIQMLLGSLDDACVRAFGVHTTEFDVPTVYRSTTFASYGECLVYLFSPSDVYCVGRSDGRATQLGLPATIGQDFVLSDVTVHNSSLIVTYAQKNELSSAVFRLDGPQSATLPVVGISGLLMFARGRPEFYLSLDGSSSSLYLRQLDCGGSGALSRSCLSNTVSQIFSSRVMLSSRNTFLDGSGSPNFVVFATAAYTSGSDGRMSVFVYVCSLDLLRFTDSDRAMPHRVYRLMQTQAPVVYTENLYENISPLGEAVLSPAWWNETTLVLGVAVESDGRVLQFPRLAVSVDSLALSGAQISDLLYAVQAPFVQLASAIFSGGELHTCLSCRATSAGRDASGYFAFGAPALAFRRLLPCSTPDTYVDNSTWGATPIQTCAALANTSELAARVPVFSMKLTCRGTQIDVVLTMATGARLVFAQVDPYVAGFPRRVLLQVRCGNAIAALYDEYDCLLGCRARLLDVTFDLSGGVGIESVRNMLPMSTGSGAWYRRLTLSSNPETVGVKSGVLAAGRWQQKALIVSKIRERQEIFVHVRRNVTVAKLAVDMRIGKEPVTKVGLDVLSVTPVLSEPATRARAGLLTVVYVPSASNLSALALGDLMSGDDRSNWQRVHAAVRLETTDPELGGCEYAARLVAVNDSLWPVSAPLPVGCALAVPQVTGQVEVQCHIELPFKLTNNESFVGLELQALTCVGLPETGSLSVELVPFMQISECPAFFFLHADTRTCVACAADRCAPGFYVSGCLELMHPARPVDCLSCPAPPHSRFPNTSSSCDTWVCRDGYFQANASACVPCTSHLKSTCREPGTRWAACSQTENERCVPCDAASLPRYAQWTNASRECVWRCDDGYFSNNGVCELCHTLTDLRLLLDGTGYRAAGGYYRFRACSESQQAVFAQCSVSDFSHRLNGTYEADAAEFGKDCPLRCREQEPLHLVSVTQPDATGFAWRAQMCIACPSWPTFANGSRLPRNAFAMSAACESSCSAAAEFFPANATNVCLWCPRSACPVGSFWSSADKCTRCTPCTARVQGANFTSNGRFDDPSSCREECPPGSFLYDANTCRRHSTVECAAGLEYHSPGTPYSDAECRACAPACLGLRETKPCRLSGNRECASCGDIEDWNSYWSESGCELLCKDGYTKLFTAAGEVCQKCWPCPRGYTLPAKPATCACVPCAGPIPQGAFYTALSTQECTWTCPLYHTVQVDPATQNAACKYSLNQASNREINPVQLSNIACSPGQRIVQGTDGAAYLVFSCQDCSVPTGMNAADLNATWAWEAGCAWKCVDGLMKYETLGTYRCGAYLQMTINTTTATLTVDWSWGNVNALLGSLLIVVLFVFCLLSRLLASKEEDEVDEEQPEKTDMEKSMKEEEL